MSVSAEQQQQFESLLKQQPYLHKGGQHNWAISHEVQRWILENLPDNASSLETGCGHSSVVFAIRGSKHTVISPFDVEHQSIKEYCAEHGIDSSSLSYHAKPSQDVIHSLGDAPLDLVLIDGDHGFPAPFIDWYYTAERIKKGGYCMVDDTQLITGEMLRDFLLMEEGRWELVTDLDKTAVFKKLTDEPVVKDFWFGQQPWADLKPDFTLRDRIRWKLEAFGLKGLAKAAWLNKTERVTQMPKQKNRWFA